MPGKTSALWQRSISPINLNLPSTIPTSGRNNLAILWLFHYNILFSIIQELCHILLKMVCRSMFVHGSGLISKISPQKSQAYSAAQLLMLFADMNASFFAAAQSTALCRSAPPYTPSCRCSNLSSNQTQAALPAYKSQQTAGGSFPITKKTIMLTAIMIVLNLDRIIAFSA